MPLFAATDLQRQKTKLLSTLVLVRNSLRDLNAIVPNLRKLGAGTSRMAPRPSTHSAVGETLIAAMATVAGAAWLFEHESAGRDAFAVVATAMLDGAQSAHPTTAA